MRRSRVSDRGGRIEARLGAAIWLTGAVALALPPSPTPTPLPRLSGGFGRPRAATPSSSGGGQSLADLVRAAQQGRDGQKPERSGVTISNKSLVTNPEKGRVSTSKPEAHKSAPPPGPTSLPAAANGASADAAARAAAEGAAGGTEAEWRETARRARKRVDEAKARVAELEAAVKKLENDFYAWDDGQYRDRVIKPAWDRTKEQAEEAKHELAGAEKELAELPEKARKAGALPGWIRE